MNNSQVAHIWAQNENETAKGSNFFCEDGVIYSYGYHFPIAKFLKDGVILFTTGYAGISTSKHIGHVRSALDFTAKRIYIPKVPAVPTKHNMREAYKILKKEMLESQFRLPKKRKYVEGYISAHNDLVDNLNELSRYFRLGFRAIPYIEDIQDAVKLSAKEIKRREEKRLAEKKAVLKMLALWKSDPNSRLPRMYGGILSKTYLRLKPDGTTIETSRGAEFPTDHAKKAWSFIKKIKKSGNRWDQNGHKIAVGHFRIDYIKGNGNLKAGCHYLDYEVMKEFAENMGW